MSGLDLKAMTVDQLVARFVEICLRQDEALLEEDLAKFRRLFEQMRAVLDELKSRPDDQRTALIPLYEHPNMQVRLKAAKNTLALAPDTARTVLESIKASQWHPKRWKPGCVFVIWKVVFLNRASVTATDRRAAHASRRRRAQGLTRTMRNGSWIR